MGKKGKMTKRPSTLVIPPGCDACMKVCKYNNPVADPFMAATWSRETPYGCNSKLTSFGLEGEIGNGN
jgi:hypothetical protein